MIDLITKLNAPLLGAMIILLLFGWRMFKFKGWNILVIAWTLNIIYLYFFEHEATLDFKVQFRTLEIGSISSIFFLAAALNISNNNIKTYKSILLSTALFFIVFFISRSILNDYSLYLFSDIVFSKKAAYPYILFNTFSLLALGLAAYSNYRIYIVGSTSKLFSFPLIIYGLIQIFYIIRIHPQEKPEPIITSYVFLSAFILKAIHFVGIFLILIKEVSIQANYKVTNEALQTLRIIFSGLTHELKTTIYMIKNINEDIKKRLDNNDYAKITTLVSNLDHQISKTANIIDKMKISSEKELHLVKININTIIHRALYSIKKAYNNKLIDFSEQLSKGLIVKVDEYRIEQAIINILRNAVDACLANSMKKARIIVKTEKKYNEGKHFVDINIIDNGIGIPKNIIRDVVKPYFTTKKGYNRGLGLFIAKYFIEACGGTLTINSPPNGAISGTCVTIRIPAE